MSFDDTMNKKIADNPEILPVNEIPKELKAQILNWKYKPDSKGNDCMFLYLKTKEGRKVVQKYTSSAYATLKNAIDAAGGYDFLTLSMYTWKQQIVGQMKLPRLLPVPQEVEEPKKAKFPK